MNLPTQNKNTFADTRRAFACTFIEPRNMTTMAKAIQLGIDGVVEKLKDMRRSGEINACKEAYCAYCLAWEMVKADDYGPEPEEWTPEQRKAFNRRMARWMRANGWALYGGMIEADVDAFLDLIEARDCYVA